MREQTRKQEKEEKKAYIKKNMYVYITKKKPKTNICKKLFKNSNHFLPIPDHMILRLPPSTQFRFVVGDGTLLSVVDRPISSPKAKAHPVQQPQPV
jgi:hypothetical protein